MAESIILATPACLTLCSGRSLKKSGNIIDCVKEGRCHSAYLELYKHIQTSDEVVDNCFDDWKRSQVLRILINWRSKNLLIEEEFAAFSAQTRGLVEGFLKRA